MEHRFYTEEELEILRKQIEENNKLATEAAIRRGVFIDPRIEKAKLK